MPKWGENPRMPRRYFIVLALTSLVAIASLGVGLVLKSTIQPAAVSAPSVKQFALIDQTGQPVDDTTYRGRWLLVFFGFTRCPDICPTSMIFASDLLQNLGPLSETLNVAFVTVDPERDTPSALKDYLANFDQRIIGLTGSMAQIAAVTDAFGVHHAKRKIEVQDDYTMDHSTAFYLVDPNGGFRRAYNLQRGADQMTADIRSAISPKE